METFPMYTRPTYFLSLLQGVQIAEKVQRIGQPRGQRVKKKCGKN